MTYLLALDQGTTSSRALLFDAHGCTVGMAQQDLPLHYPQAGWVEVDAMQLWQTQLNAARQVLQQTGVSAQQVHAIGVVNQRETTVVWHRQTGQPIAPAIVWQDRRTANHCLQLRQEGWAPTIREWTGLELDAYFSATKVQWVLNNTPHARAQAQRGELAFGTVDAWLVYQLTGGQVHATDVSNASRTMLWNLHTQAWDERLLDLFGIAPSMLPCVVPSSGVVGQAQAHWLGASMPIAGLAGDQQAALFGQMCFDVGCAKNTYGTGCFMLMNTGDRAVASNQGLLSTVAWQREGQATQYALEGSVFMAGATVQWLRDGLQIINQSADVEALAASVPHTDDVWLVPAFAGLGAPHWDGHARAMLLGMTRGTHKGHIARAALESIALQSSEVLQAMQADCPQAQLSSLRVDGGACANSLLMQMQADIAGLAVVRPEQIESTALGAAFLAGLATGIWHDLNDLNALSRVDRVFEPQWSADRRQAHMHRWLQAVQRSGQWMAA